MLPLDPRFNCRIPMVSPITVRNPPTIEVQITI